MSPESPRRLCNARLSNGRGYCRAQPVKGKLRCKFHGGAATGPRTPEGKARTVEAMAAGRARWLAQMRELKAKGLIEKIPGGRRSSSQPRKTGDRIIDKAAMLVAERQAEFAAELTEADPLLLAPIDEDQKLGLPAPPALPWDKMSSSAKLHILTGRSLDMLREIFDTQDEEGATLALRLKLLSIKKDTALSVLATQVKVDDTRLRARRSEDGLARLLEEIREYQAKPRGPKAIEGTTEPST